MVDHVPSTQNVQRCPQTGLWTWCWVWTSLPTEGVRNRCQLVLWRGVCPRFRHSITPDAPQVMSPSCLAACVCALRWRPRCLSFLGPQGYCVILWPARNERRTPYAPSSDVHSLPIICSDYLDPSASRGRGSRAGGRKQLTQPHDVPGLWQCSSAHRSPPGIGVSSMTQISGQSESVDWASLVSTGISAASVSWL
jgi:hypothetical protein